MSIYLTDDIEVKTKKGKLGAAKQIFLEGDTQTVEKEIQDINSRHNTLNTKHDSLSKTVQGIAATSGANTATNVTYDNTNTGITAENIQDAVDKLVKEKANAADVNAELDKKFNKESIVQDLLDDETKVASSKCVKAAIDETNTKFKNSTALLKYKKAKIALIGDSISTYEGWIPEGYRNYYPQGKIDSVEKTYWHILCNMLSASIQNLSYAGSTVTNQNATGHTLCKRVPLVNSDSSLIIIALGVNDNQKEDNVGGYDYNKKIEEYDESIFTEAYIKGVRTLMQLHPSADLLLVAMAPRNGMPKRTAAIKEIAKHYGLMFFDARTCYSGSLHPDTDATDNGDEMKNIADGIFNCISSSISLGLSAGISNESARIARINTELEKIDSFTQQINDIVLGVSYLEGGFDAANHVFNNAANYYHTDFIDVSTNVLSLNMNVRFVVYFNESKEYLSHSENKVDNSMLENAAFASVVFLKNDVASLVITSSKKGLIASQNEVTDEKIETLEKRVVNLYKGVENNISNNTSLLLGTVYLEGGFDAANHVFNNAANYYHTDFIDVSTNVLSLNMNVRFVVYFNESKEYLSHSENKVDNSMLENAAFASVVFLKNDVASLVITSSKKGLIASQNEVTDEKIEYLNKTSVVKTESVNILDSFSVKGAEIQDGIIKLPLNVQNSSFTISSNLVLPKGTFYFSYDVKLSANISNAITYGAPLILDINKYTTRDGYTDLTKDKWVRVKLYANIEEECKANFLIGFKNSVIEDGYLYIRNLMITTNENYKYTFVKPNPIAGYLSEDKIFGDSTIPVVWENGGWNATDKVFNTDKNYVHTQFISLENNVLNVSSFTGARFIVFYNIAKEVIQVLDSPSNIEKSLIEDNDYVILVYNVNSIQNLVISNLEATIEEKIQSNEDRIDKLIKESEGDNILNKIYRNRYIMFGFVAGKGLVILGSSNMRKWGLIEKKFFFYPKKVLYNDGQKDVINGFRDPAFIQIDDWFYFTYTVVNLYEQTGVGNQIGFCRTKDFVDFEELDNLAIEDSEGTDFKNGWAWAPDFFRIDDKIYIVCAVSPTTTNYGGQNFYHYICEYDYKNHKLSKAFKTNISFIDCHIYYIDGKYYAVGSGNKIYKSNTLLSNSWTSINASASIAHYEAQILTRLDDNRFLLIGQDVYNANDGVNDQHLCYQVLDSLESSFSEKKPLSYDNDSLEWLHTQQRSEVHEVTHATIFDTKQWRDNNNNFYTD